VFCSVEKTRFSCIPSFRLFHSKAFSIFKTFGFAGLIEKLCVSLYCIFQHNSLLLGQSIGGTLPTEDLPMDSQQLWHLFCETGDPVCWLYYTASKRQGDGVSSQ